MKTEEKVENSITATNSPSERAAKKAARRAAFIQEVAEAVAIKVCGPAAIRSPFAQALHEQDMATWRVSKTREEEQNGLVWAIRQGLLPMDTTMLPTNEEQRQLLQRHIPQMPIAGASDSQPAAPH